MRFIHTESRILSWLSTAGIQLMKTGNSAVAVAASLAITPGHTCAPSKPSSAERTVKSRSTLVRPQYLLFQSHASNLLTSFVLPKTTFQGATSRVPRLGTLRVSHIIFTVPPWPDCGDSGFSAREAVIPYCNGSPAVLRSLTVVTV